MIVGNPRIYDRKFAFRLVIEGFTKIEFSKAGPLSAKIAVVKHREGGRLIPNKSLGLVDFDPITLERGASFTDYDLYLWFVQAANAAANVGLKDQLVKRNGTLMQLDRDGLILKTWSIINAFPTEFNAGDWDGSANEVVINKMVLEYDYFFPI
jgi:phage tail-like protein